MSKRRKSRVRAFLFSGVSSGSILGQMITQEAKEQGINHGLPPLFRLQLAEHISEVVIITIRSEIAKWKRDYDERRGKVKNE